MAQFIAIVLRDLKKFSEADFAPLLEPEAERARQMYAAGTVRAIYGRKDAPGAVLFLEAPDMTAARAALDSLPLVEKRMLVVEQFFEVGPYRGFGPRG